MPGNIGFGSGSSSTPTPNYTDPPTRSWLPAYAIPFHACATLLVAVRVGLRYHRKAGGFGVDDVSRSQGPPALVAFDRTDTSQGFLIPAWLCATGSVAMACYSSYAGYSDRHIWDIRLEKLWHIALVRRRTLTYPAVQY